MKYISFNIILFLYYNFVIMFSDTLIQLIVNVEIQDKKINYWGDYFENMLNPMSS
jgi:hypothetical protein